MSKTILLKRGTEANLPDLQEGEPGWATDTKQLYVGDGVGAPVKVGTEVSDFMDTVLDDANAAAVIATLGLDADIATFSLPANTTISAFGRTLIDDADAATALTTLGVSTFAKTILDDTSASDVRATISAQTLSALLTALATAGAANTHAVMNAAGTAPEYAVPYFMGTFTRDCSIATGDANVTGVPFKPKIVIILGGFTAAAAATIGISDATNNYCIYNNHYASAGTWAMDTSYSLYLYEDTGKGVGGIVKTMNSDGFTMTYTKVGSAVVTATFGYLALR